MTLIDVFLLCWSTVFKIPRKITLHPSIELPEGTISFV